MNHRTDPSPKRLLLVEDDQRLSDFVSRGLRAEGYSVEVVATGREGLLLAEDGGFNLIILDIGLPDINGQQIVERLRSDGRMMPILMLTARDALSDKVLGLRAGADDYMTKPFSFEELLARIGALLRRTEMDYQVDSTELKILDLVLDRESHDVRRGGKLIELTAKEFNLLEFFLQSKGKVLSRTRILEYVWGYSNDPLTNVVDVYIRQLRKKVDDGHRVKLIKTVRGFGYKLDETKEASFDGDGE